MKRNYTQVEHSGHRIPQDTAGKMRDSHRILQGNTGNRWNVEAVFRSKIRPDFSGGFLPTSCTFRQELAGYHRKKSENFPSGILLPQNHRNHLEPDVSRPDCSTWDIQQGGRTLFHAPPNTEKSAGTTFCALQLSQFLTGSTLLLLASSILSTRNLFSGELASKP